MSPMQGVRMMGKQKEGYGNIKVLAGGVDALMRSGHRLIEEMRNY